MDKSWIRTSRTKKQYIDGVEAFIKYAVHNLQKMKNINPLGNKQQLMMPCLCTTCLNCIEHKVEEVQFHFLKYGIDLSYTKWDKHGEKDEQATTTQIPVNATTEFIHDTDFDMEFGLEIPIDGPATVETVNATKESFDKDDLAKFQELLLDAEKPLYKGCPGFTKLFAIVKLLYLKGKYGAFDKFFTELLRLLKKMLHAGNEMVEKTYQAKKLMRMMRSGYKKIHVCSNNCILYWKDNKELTVCATCGISRWKVDNKTHKVYETIPAKAWRTIDEKFLKIAKDPRNLRLGISADGVDVNSGTTHHNVWPVLSVIYNLPLWLCIKRMFIMLSVLISGYSRNDIDVFLEPLVDDLHTLFKTGVDTYDASTKENFSLRAVVLWMINDYPALGTLYGCPYSGFKEKNVGESLVGTLLNVPGKTKDGMNARLDLAEWGIKSELFARQGKDKTTLPLAGYTLTNAEKDIFCETLCNIKVPQGYCSNFSSLVILKDRKLIGLKSHNYHMLMQEFLPIIICSIMHPPTRYAVIRNRPEGCITQETIAEETIEFFSEYHKTMKTIGIPPDKHVTNENEDEKPLSANKSSEVFGEVFQKAHLYVIQNTNEIVLHIKRHKHVLKTKNLAKRIELLENEHSKSFAKWLREEVERELAISKDSVSEPVRWISYGPLTTIVKYEAYNINGYTFCMKSNDGIVYQNSRVSVEAVDLHISKEVATTRKSFYYGVLQEICVLDYHFRQIPL
nr:hypothetical protein [Tanacetum cinerariifolium]